MDPDVCLQGPLMHPDPVRELAADAAQVLRERGWCQGDYHRNGNYCLLGAARMADHGDTFTKFVNRWAYTDLETRAERLVGCASIADWNDDPERTADEVIALLERIAAGEGA